MQAGEESEANGENFWRKKKIRESNFLLFKKNTKIQLSQFKDRIGFIQ